MARDTPVGPPWITTSNGYFFDASKSAGLCRTPSIVAPSWLFHDTTSSVLAVQPAVCAFMSVSFLAPTYTSLIVFAPARRHAIVWPSFDTEKLELTVASGAGTFAIALDSGSSL